MHVSRTIINLLISTYCDYWKLTDDFLFLSGIKFCRGFYELYCPPHPEKKIKEVFLVFEPVNNHKLNHYAAGPALFRLHPPKKLGHLHFVN